MDAAVAPVRYLLDDLIIDTGRCRVERAGVEVPLPRLSYELLLALAQSAPNLVTVDELNARVWPDVVISPETISQRIKLLRAGLGDPAATPRYVGTVRGRGYRLLVPVEALPAFATYVAPPDAARGPPNRPAMRWAGVAAGLVLAALLAWLAMRDPSSPASPPPTRLAADADPSIAVLPLMNRSSRPEDAVFADGMHDDILTQLAQIDGIRVIARTSVERFRATTLDIREIGALLDVATVLEGSVQRDGDRVRVNLQLIDTANGAHLWARNYDSELSAGQLFALQSEIAQSIAAELQPMLGPAEHLRRRGAPTSSLEAWQDYQAGRRLLAGGRSTAVPEAQVLFERAIERDPEFALAHAGRADALAQRAGGIDRLNPELLAEASASRDRALMLAPDDAEVLAVSSWIAQDQGDLVRAEREVRRALELSPSNAQAASGYGALLAETGRPREALRYVEAAARLDPFSIDALSTLGWLLQDVGRPDEALVKLLRVLEIEPARADEHSRIGVLFARTYGRLDLGVPWLERAATLDPGALPALRWLMALNDDLGRLDEAGSWRLALERSLSPGADDWSIVFADVYAAPAAAASAATRRLQHNPRDTVALAVLTHLDFDARRLDRARRRLEQAHSALADASAPDLRGVSRTIVLLYAETLRRSGDPARASLFATAVERQLGDLQRLSPSGFGLADVRAHAVRSDVEAALTALEVAEREGWRGPDLRYVRDRDPTLATIRGLPRFDAVFQRVERDLAEQRRRLDARTPGEPLPTSPP